MANDIEVYRGDNHTISIIFEEDGSRKDISGWTVFFTVKDDVETADANAVLTADVTSHVSASNGETEVSLGTSDTDLNVGDYYYDIQYKNSTGDIGTVLFGNFIVKRDITRRTS